MSCIRQPSRMLSNVTGIRAAAVMSRDLCCPHSVVAVPRSSNVVFIESRFTRVWSCRIFLVEITALLMVDATVTAVDCRRSVRRPSNSCHISHTSPRFYNKLLSSYPSPSTALTITDYAARRSQCSSSLSSIQAACPANTDGCVTCSDKSCLTTKASQSRSRSAVVTSISTVRSSSTFGRAQSDRRAPRQAHIANIADWPYRRPTVKVVDANQAETFFKVRSVLRYRLPPIVR